MTACEREEIVQSKEPLVSVTIPTYNSSPTLGLCLKSVQDQTYQNMEIIVVDSYSSDNTREVAEKFNARIITTRQKLLRARFLGLRESKGEYTMLLDSDQVLDRTAIERAVKIIEKYDMLCLEEYTYNPKTWLQKLFEADRQLIHSAFSEFLDPVEGVLMARFYRKEVLLKAFEAIPKEIMPLVVAHDHAIIYYETYKVSQKVGILPKAVWHMEPANLAELWRKNYRYGKTTRKLAETGFYRYLLRKKVRLRKSVLGTRNFGWKFQSYLLLFLKAVAYQIGFWSR